ncbi:MAG: type I-E CRISPR-associated protein Cse2/CasB [Negativicutes bacterium]|nr:type I-E CRISPR-associated protein Cse2/CasB [Negativicutes bacterium]
MREQSILVKNYVKSKIIRLCKSPNDASTKAILAKARRGLGKAPGSLPELWCLTLADMPEALLGKTVEASYGEWAAYIGLTLFALHQQGKDLKTQCMNCEGEKLGLAVRKLVTNEDEEHRIKHRFDAVMTASSMEEVSYHLRGLIQLFKMKSITLDYPALAEDLYLFQFSSVRDSVCLQWGRDFYRSRVNSEKLEERIGADENNGEK